MVAAFIKAAVKKSHEATHISCVVFKIRSPGKKSAGGTAGQILVQRFTKTFTYTEV
jgi:hypothetical protein